MNETSDDGRRVPYLMGGVFGALVWCVAFDALAVLVVWRLL